MGIPFQYKATIELGLLGRRTGNSPRKVPLPPPLQGAAPTPPCSGPYQISAPPYPGHEAESSSMLAMYDNQIVVIPLLHLSVVVANLRPGPLNSLLPSIDELWFNPYLILKACPICHINPKNMAFGCGHQTCCGCGENLQACPICRNSVIARIRLY